MSNCSLFFRYAGLALAGQLALGQPCFANDLVRISPAQMRASAITLTPVRNIAGSVGNKLQLQGFAVLPPQALETVSAPLNGYVQSMLVGPGDVLRAGQPVARLHSSQLMELQKDYVQLQTQALQAQDRLQRSERLLADGIVAPSRVREDSYLFTQAQVAAQERQQALRLAGMGEAELQRLLKNPQLRSELTLHAARSGTVVEVLANAGQRLEAGAPLLKLARSGLLALELQVTVAQSQGVRVGAKVQVSGCQRAGTVHGLGSLVRGGNQAVTVHVDMPAGSDCLRPNQAVQAEVQLAQSSAVGIPASALFQHGGRDHVFVQSPQGFVATPVQVLSRNADQVLLSSGVATGVNVVSAGIATVKAMWLGMGEIPADQPAGGVKP